MCPQVCVSCCWCGIFIFGPHLFISLCSFFQVSGPQAVLLDILNLIGYRTCSSRKIKFENSMNLFIVVWLLLHYAEKEEVLCVPTFKDGDSGFIKIR